MRACVRACGSFLTHGATRTHACVAGWDHLSGNLFFLLCAVCARSLLTLEAHADAHHSCCTHRSIFGKSVEEEEGAFGVWLAYLLCGGGASLASFLLLPKVSAGAAVVSLGASGAVFGLFAVSVLVKLSFDWRKLLESFILGGFVWERIWSEIGMTTQGGGVGATGINHLAHLAGAMCGVLLVLGLSRMLPPAKDGDDDDDERRRLSQ